MSTLFNDLKLRIEQTNADTTFGQFAELRDEIEESCLTPDERGELNGLLADAFLTAKIAADQSQK
jgi:hypothetical protein